MTLPAIMTFRLALGVWTAIAVAFGAGGQLSFLTPLFAAIFLAFPAWIGWRMAIQLLRRLAFSLLIGLLISEYLLSFPVISILVFGLLFFFIYYNDTPAAPPFSSLFMTLGVTIVPIMGFAGTGVSHLIAIALLVNFAGGLFFAWLFHSLMPNSLAKQLPAAAPAQKPPPPPLPSREERIKKALASTIVALIAVTIFFSFNLLSYAYAMIQICLMVGSADAKASLQGLKAAAMSCLIGGIAIVIVFNLLVAVPTYSFMLILTLLCSLFFSRQVFSGKPEAKLYFSGLTTFLVLLGTSTMVDKVASTNFYLRIAQILFAGLFAVVGLMVVGAFLDSNLKKIIPRSLLKMR
jgi:hypothetical protein